jgi:hypothetical protein
VFKTDQDCPVGFVVQNLTNSNKVECVNVSSLVNVSDLNFTGANFTANLEGYATLNSSNQPFYDTLGEDSINTNSRILYNNAGNSLCTWSNALGTGFDCVTMSQNNNTVCDRTNNCNYLNASNVSQFLNSSYFNTTYTGTHFNTTADMYLRVARLPLINGTDTGEFDIVVKSGNNSFRNIRLWVSTSFNTTAGTGGDSTMMAFSSASSHTETANTEVNNLIYATRLGYNLTSGYWYLDLRKYTSAPNLIINITPRSPTNWQFFTQSINVTNGALTDTKELRLFNGLTATINLAQGGYADSSGYSDYSRYGDRSDTFTSTQNINKTDRWARVGTISFSYNAAYLNGQTYINRMQLQQIPFNQSVNADRLEDIQLDVKATIQNVTTGTQYNNALINYSLEVSGTLYQHNASDFAILTTTNGTGTTGTAKTISIYMKLKDAYSIYNVLFDGRYGYGLNSNMITAYSSANVLTPDSNSNTVTTLTPSQGAVTYGTADNVIFGTVNATNFIGNGSQLTGIIAGNTSWNESYADNTYLKLDQTTPQATVGTFTFPKVLVNTNDIGLGSLLQIGRTELTEYAIGDITYATGEAVSGNLLYGDGTTYSFYIYAYKTTPNGRVYSSSPYLVEITPPGDYNTYDASLTWDSVPEASGYKILFNSYASETTGTTILFDGQSGTTQTVLPSSPVYEYPYSITAIDGIITEKILHNGNGITISAPSDSNGDYQIVLDSDRVTINSLDITNGIYKNGNPYALTNPMSDNLHMSQYSIDSYDPDSFTAYPLSIHAGDDGASQSLPVYIRGGVGFDGTNNHVGQTLIATPLDTGNTYYGAINGNVLINKISEDDDFVHKLQVNGEETIYSRLNPMYSRFLNIEFVSGTLISSGDFGESYKLIPYFDTPLGVVYCDFFQAGTSGTAPEDSDIYLTWNDITDDYVYDGIRIVRLLDGSYVDLSPDATSFTATTSTSWIADAIYTPTERIAYGASASFNGNVSIYGNATQNGYSVCDASNNCNYVNTSTTLNDTLQSVTDRGNSTTQSITTNGITLKYNLPAFGETNTLINNNNIDVFNYVGMDNNLTNNFANLVIGYGNKLNTSIDTFGLGIIVGVDNTLNGATNLILNGNSNTLNGQQRNSVFGEGNSISGVDTFTVGSNNIISSTFGTNNIIGQYNNLNSYRGNEIVLGSYNSISSGNGFNTIIGYNININGTRNTILKAGAGDYTRNITNPSIVFTYDNLNSLLINSTAIYLNQTLNTKDVTINGTLKATSFNFSGIAGTGNYLCINGTAGNLYRNTSCP